MWNFRLLLFVLYCKSSICYCQTNINIQKDKEQAEIIFEKVHEICMFDNGNLCDVNLWCPLLLIDRESRFVYSNVPLSFSDTPSENRLHTGILPYNYLIVNSTVYIDSILYTIFAFDKERSIEVLTETAIHEIFHYWQEKNDWYQLSYKNNHVETKWGRIFLKLEMKAIQNALSSKNDQEMENAVKEALYFRNQRQKLFPDKIAEEIAFEIQEGIPDYVKYTLCIKNDSLIKLRLASQIEYTLNSNKFERSFGYETGSSYAFLINNPIALKKAYINGKDLVEILKRLRNITDLPDSLSLFTLSKYNFNTIVLEEDSIEKSKMEFNNQIKQKFQKGSILNIPVEEGISFGFNSYEVYSIDSIGTYYPYISVSGNFGQIQSDLGGIITSTNIILFWDENFLKEKYKILLNDDWFILKELGVFYLKPKE